MGNLAVSMLNQGRENQAIAAMEYSEILNPTAEIYEAQSQIYKEAMYVFKGARQLCRAALVSAEPKQSLEYRKKARSCSRKPLRAERSRIAVAMCTFAI